MESQSQDGAAMQAAAAAKNPSTVPDQFKNADGTINLDALSAAYREAQQKITEQGTELASLKKAPAAPSKSALDEAFAKPVESPKTFEMATAELNVDGKLSQETRQALKEKHGMDDAAIDAMVSGHAAQRIALGNALAEAAGGRDNMIAAINHAKKSMSESEQAAFRAALEGPTGPLVMRGLVAQLQAQAPHTSAQAADTSGGVNGGFGTAAENKPFESAQELTAHFRSERYRTDPNFRTYCAKRMLATRNAATR